MLYWSVQRGKACASPFFVNRIAECAEEQGHHPDILLTWGRVKVTVWTHKSDGLTENDFIYAAKCDKLRG